MREIVVVELHKYKHGSLKRVNAWTHVANILNSTEEPKFKGIRQPFEIIIKLFDSTFKKKRLKKDKASGKNSTELNDTETAVQDVIEKIAAAIHEYNNSSEINMEKKMA